MRCSLEIDPTILSALSLDAVTTIIASYGCLGFASVFKGYTVGKKDNDHEES
jgi:hypothetical protein